MKLKSIARTRWFTLPALVAIALSVANAQFDPTRFTTTNSGGPVAEQLPTVFGPRGLTLAVTNPQFSHEAHFARGKAQEDSFTPFNVAVASEIARLPLVSPASGFVYTINRALGVVEQSNQTFGPVLTERAETVGRGRVSLGVAYQWFRFDSIDGIDLDDVPGVLTHEPITNPFGFDRDVITTRTSIDLKIHQTTAFATVGLTDRIDVSVAIPIVNARMGVISNATIHRVATPPPGAQFHFFDSTDINGSTFHVYSTNSSKTGIGDVLFRGKWTVLRGESSAFAVAADVRTPTGDEMNFLGSGAWGVRPFIAYSRSLGTRVAPHFNLGYQINGSSVLAGDVVTGKAGHLPNALTYAAGADIAAHRRVTLAADLLGERVFNGVGVRLASFPAAGGAAYPTTSLLTQSYSVVNGSVGGKVSLTRTLLLTANALFRLNDSGLKSKVVPLVGLSYSF